MSSDYFNIQTEVSTNTLFSDTWGQHKVVLEVYKTILLALFSSKYWDKAEAQISFKVQRLYWPASSGAEI